MVTLLLSLQYHAPATHFVHEPLNNPVVEVSAKQCCCRTNAAASSSSAGFTEADYTILNSLLQWPAQQLFPAYDIARLVALDAEGAQHLATHAGTLTQDPSGQDSATFEQLPGFCCHTTWILANLARMSGADTHKHLWRGCAQK